MANDSSARTAAVDDDLAAQARPGHGIPSPDPDPAAQFALAVGEARREAHSVLVGGGEVARSISRHGESRLRSVVFVAAVTPCLMHSADNPDGPLTADKAQHQRQALVQDRAAFFDQFTRGFYSAHGVLQVTEAQCAEALALCHLSAPQAALACMDAFSHTDFRDDLALVTVPTLVVHGSADAVVPLGGSGQRTHRAVRHSQLVVVKGAPHGLNLTHAAAFNDALLSFLQR